MTTTITPDKALNSLERTTLRNAEATIQRHLSTFVDVGNALAVIRDQQLYRESYKTFDAYLKGKWDFQKSHAYRLIAARDVVENVSHGGQIVPNLPAGLPKPTNERQVRPLTELPPEDQPKAWAAAVEKAEELGKPVTAAIVEEVVEEMKGDTVVFSPAKSEPSSKDEPEEVDDSPEAVMKETNSAIESYCRKLIAFATDNFPKDKWITHNGRGEHALQKIKDACETLRTCKCSALCPKCNGEGCRRCLDTGRVTRYMLEQLS